MAETGSGVAKGADSSSRGSERRGLDGGEDSKLKYENERLKEQVRLLQETLSKSHSATTGSLEEVMGARGEKQGVEPEVSGTPLRHQVSGGEEGEREEERLLRSRSRSVSPGGEEERDKFPSGVARRPAPGKPVPLPRSRGHTSPADAAAESASAMGMDGGPAHPRHVVLPSSSVPATVGFTPPTPISEDVEDVATSGGVVTHTASVNSSELAKPKVPLIPPGVTATPTADSGSPVPKPRSKVLGTPTDVKPPAAAAAGGVAGTGVGNHVGTRTLSASSDTTSDKTGSGTKAAAAGSGKLVRGGSADSAAEKAKAIITLQKLLPSSSSSKGRTPLLPPNKKLLTPAIPSSSTSNSKVESDSERSTATTTSSNNISSKQLTSPSPVTPAIQSTPPSRAIPIPKPISTSSTSASSVGAQSLVQPKVEADRDDDKAKRSTKAAGESFGRKVDEVRSPLSSSVPPPSLLSSKERAGGKSGYVKAPLNSVAKPLPSAGGKVKYKKVTLTDESWIKRKESLGDTSGSEPNTPKHQPATPPLTTTTTKSAAKPSSSTSSATTITTTTSSSASKSTSATPRSGGVTDPPSRPLPYRSHPILPGPKSVNQPFIPSSGSSLEPGSAAGKVAPPRPPEPAPASRGRTDTVSGGGNGGKKRFWGKSPSDGKKVQRRHSFTRSSSNDEIAPLQSEVKGEYVYVPRHIMHTYVHT